MASFLAQYSMREKLIVALALLVLIGLGLHAFIIGPYQERASTLRAELAQQNADLDWMHSVVARLPVTGVAVSSDIDGTLANYVDQAVRRQGLSTQLSQMSPVGEDTIRMRYTAVEFDRLVSFIAGIYASGLEVKDIRITSADIPGIVDSSIVLVRQ